MEASVLLRVIDRPCGPDRGVVLGRPLHERAQKRKEGMTERGQLIFDARRLGRVDGAREIAVALQIAQRLRQHALRDIRDETAKLREAARAIGKAGLTESLEQQLFEKMQDEQLVTDAALALMLGGTPDVAARAVASLEGQPPSVIEQLQEMWYNSFGYWSTEDLEKGHIFRFVDNAEAGARVTAGRCAAPSAS